MTCHALITSSEFRRVSGGGGRATRGLMSDSPFC